MEVGNMDTMLIISENFTQQPNLRDDVLPRTVLPNAKKKRTKRGIAEIALPSKLETRDANEDIGIPIYTSRIERFREEKKQLQTAAAAFEYSQNNCSDHEDDIEYDIPSSENKSKSDDENQAPSSPPQFCPGIIRVVPKKKCQKLLDKLASAEIKFKDELMQEQLASTEESLVDERNDCLTVVTNREICLKIRWKGKIRKISVKNNQSFRIITEMTAKMLDEPVGKLILTFNDEVIKPSDTLSSLGIKVSDIIDCGLLSTDLPPKEPENDPDLLNLKLQAKDMKQKIVFTMLKTEPMTVLIEKFAEHRQIPATKIILQFDGEDLDEESTADDCGIEDDFCIDVIIRS